MTDKEVTVGRKNSGKSHGSSRKRARRQKASASRQRILLDRNNANRSVNDMLDDIISKTQN